MCVCYDINSMTTAFADLIVNKTEIYYHLNQNSLIQSQEKQWFVEKRNLTSIYDCGVIDFSLQNHLGRLLSILIFS